MTKSKTLPYLAAIFIPLFGIAASPHVAQARGLSSYGGNPLDNTPRCCYKENAGGVVYQGGSGTVCPASTSCPATGRWEVAMPWDGTSLSSVGVNVKKAAAGTSAPTCQLFSANNDDLLTGVSSAFAHSPSVGWELLTPSISFSMYSLNLFIACWNLSPGDEIGPIDY